MRHHLRTKALSRADWVVLGIALASPSCSKPAAEAFDRGLLQRPPDHVLQAPGQLLPSLEDQWGAATAGPWEELTVVPGPADAASPRVTSRGPRSGVYLDAVGAQDRTIELRLSLPTPPDSGDVDAAVLLNGNLIGELDLHARLERFEVSAPAEHWRAGRNHLEIACSLDGRPAPKDLVFSMGPVHYGDSALLRADLAAGTLSFEPRTSATYRVLPPPNSALVLAGEWHGLGRLELEVATSDTEFMHPALARTFDSDSDLRDTQLLELPDDAADLEIRLRFTGDASSTFRLTDLALRSNVPEERPPVVLIVVDTLAARNMSVYGYSRPTTPHLAALAAESVVFDQAYSNASWTLPSFQSMLTGLYPKSHQPDTSHIQGRNPFLWEKHQLSGDRFTLAERFRASGWRTFAHFDNPWLTATFGIEQGYDSFSSKASERGPADRGGGIDLVAADFLDWLDTEVAGDPFFATLHSFDVHAPYAAPPEWVARVSEVESSLQVPERIPAGSIVYARGSVPAYASAAADEKHEDISAKLLLDAYDACIAEVDDKLGRLLNELRERDLFDRSLIVVTADHGEAMVDGDAMFSHSVSAAPVIHVPLIVKPPGNSYPAVRVGTPVQLVDLVPTILDVAGVRFDPDEFHGRSLLPAMRGETVPARPILTTEGTIDHAAIRWGDHRLIITDLGRGHPAARMTAPGLDSDWMREHFPTLAGKPLTPERYQEAVRLKGGLGGLLGLLSRTLPEFKYELYDTSTDFYESENLWPVTGDLHVGLMRTMAAELQIAFRETLPPDQVEPGAGMSDATIEALKAAGYLED